MCHNYALHLSCGHYWKSNNGWMTFVKHVIESDLYVMRRDKMEFFAVYANVILYFIF